MTATLLPNAKQQFFDTNGRPLAGGQVYFYIPNTSTLKNTWQDAGKTVLNTNPVVLDANGQAIIYGDGQYRQVVYDVHGNLIWDRLTDSPALNSEFQSFVSSLSSSTGSDNIGYIATGAGAQKRSLLDRGRDTVSAFDFMTPTQIANVRAGVVTDITAGLQAAIDSFTTFAGTVELPPGNFRISSPIVTSGKGMRIIGAARYGTYLTAADGSTFDMLRIAHQQCEVANIIFRPGSASQVPIRIYAGRAHIHDNYLLAAVDEAGIGILLTDTDPVSSAFIAGAYGHTLENNVIGDSGNAFAYGITESSQFGITATRFFFNNILSDRPIQINKGGGNSYGGNLLQSSTGTSSTKAGVGITLGPTVVGEKIWGNYFELFLAMVEMQNASNANQLAHIVGNHNDNCAAPVSDAGAKNYILEDAVGHVINNFGFSTRATSSQWGVNTPSGVSGVGMDTSGNCFFGAQSGANHLINRVGAVEGNIILTLQGGGNSASFFSHVTGAGGNAAASALSLKANSVNGRSINSGGTNNAGGADMAEYMRKAEGCGIVAKGQIVGINSNGEITDQWASSLTFATKSTNPSFVGGDIWAAHLGERPVPPAMPPEDADEAALARYAEERTQYEQAMMTWEAEHEAARQCVDRIAFCGQVPVNVLGAAPGQYIVPVQDGDGIKGIAKDEADMTLVEYMRAIGKVIAIEPDGRARIIVKIA